MRDPIKLGRYARAIEPGLIRYPAIDPDSFFRAVDSFVRSLPGD
jgi:hypothetical protein